MLTSNFQQLTHPGDLDADVALLQECLDGSRDRYEVPKPFFRPDGAVVSALLSVTVIRDARGDAQHSVPQKMDLTQLHAAEQQLRLLAERDWIAGGCTTPRSSGFSPWA